MPRRKRNKFPATPQHLHRIEPTGDDWRIGQPEATPASIDRERARLTAKMHGAHAPALLAVAGDSVLSDRLRSCIEAGMPPVPLDHTPQYRRAAQVDDAMDVWTKSSRGGPCAYCGTITARRGRKPVSGMDAVVTHAFTIAGKLAACQWCADVIAEYGVDELASWVYAQAAGITGMNFDGPRRVRFAHELNVSGSTPWAHVDTAELRDDAVKFYDYIDFSERPRQSIAGIDAPWTGRPDRALWPPARDLEEDDLQRARRERLEHEWERQSARYAAEDQQTKRRLEASARNARTLSAREAEQVLAIEAANEKRAKDRAEHQAYLDRQTELAKYGNRTVRVTSK